MKLIELIGDMWNELKEKQHELNHLYLQHLKPPRQLLDQMDNFLDECDNLSPPLVELGTDSKKDEMDNIPSVPTHEGQYPSFNPTFDEKAKNEVEENKTEEKKQKSLHRVDFDYGSAAAVSEMQLKTDCYECGFQLTRMLDPVNANEGIGIMSCGALTFIIIVLFVNLSICVLFVLQDGLETFFFYPVYHFFLLRLFCACQTCSFFMRFFLHPQKKLLAYSAQKNINLKFIVNLVKIKNILYFFKKVVRL
ncbi:hypothetical protein RFI_32916 [Reticulomyxa filosa]|uniref:Uncharacterized protein n=1 Tax=Reticulomyxa filosa TaxID=46433 RepID=X6LSZ0_RETFI|nr:hypothetical protein RFI_32916 [Reticulomyxa filosa]|eukprot:ETO04481.1 hypothetical protein RFI_32916 [Reticulomyxa filosa]